MSEKCRRCGEPAEPVEAGGTMWLLCGPCLAALKCGICGVGPESDLRRPMRGWVEDGYLPELVCSPCLRKWSVGELEAQP